jgi:hypothetical protein
MRYDENEMKASRRRPVMFSSRFHAPLHVFQLPCHFMAISKVHGRDGLITFQTRPSFVAYPFYFVFASLSELSSSTRLALVGCLLFLGL